MSLLNVLRNTEFSPFLNYLYKKKLGDSFLGYNTPFWGNATRTHVAGTHGCFGYGLESEMEFYINVLCGKNLLKKYLNSNNVSYKESQLKELVELVKSESVSLGRALNKQEIINLICTL